MARAFSSKLNTDMTAASLRKYFLIVGFVVLTDVVMKSSVSWVITPCSQLKVNRHLGPTCRLHLQGQRISQVRNRRESWRWRRHVPPKRRLIFNGLHGVIFQKTELFISQFFYSFVKYVNCTGWDPICEDTKNTHEASFIHVFYVLKYEHRNIYFIMAVPVLLYGSEAWTVTSRDESRLQAAEIRCLRAVKGCTRQSHLKNEDIQRN
jgi:hypothetical protein